MEKLVGLVSSNYSVGDFGKLTKHRPIAAIPFGSRYRLIDFPLSNMVNSGITSVGLITPHLYRSIMDHLGSGKEFGLSRKNGGFFILPGSTYGYDLGKGKISIKDLKGNIQYFKRSSFERIVYSTCNKIYNIDYRDVEKAHIEDEANITIIYKKVKEAAADERVLDINENGKITGFRKLKKSEKNVNLFLDSMITDKDISLKFIEWYRDNSYIDLLDAVSENLSHLNVLPYEFKGYAKSINNVKDYLDASTELLDDDVIKELFMQGRLIHTKVHDAAPVKYFETSKVSKALVGTGSIIKGNIENSIIFRDTIVEEGAKIKNSVIMQKSHIKKNAVIENAIIEKNVVVGEGEVYKGTQENPMVIIND